MIKTALKHFLYEHALNVMFERIQLNFMSATIDGIMAEGKRFSYIECDWLDHRLQIWNVKISKISRVGILGNFIEISSDEPIRAIKLDYQDNSLSP